MLQHPYPPPPANASNRRTLPPGFFFGSAHVMHLCISSFWTFFCCGVKHKINNQSACIYRVSAPISEINTIPHVQMMKKKTNN